MAAGAAAAAARRRKINASLAIGMVVTISPDDFQALIQAEENPVVVRSQVLTYWRQQQKYYRHLGSVKGFAFHTSCVEEMALLEGVLLTTADEIKLPSDFI